MNVSISELPLSKRAGSINKNGLHKHTNLRISDKVIFSNRVATVNELSISIN